MAHIAAELREANVKDVDAIHATVVSAYHAEPHSERWEQWRRTAEQWQEFLVLERRGEVVGAVHIGRDTLTYGDCGKLLKGDVGHVSIREDLQAQGLGTVLMTETVRYLNEHGFHLSRLGGLMHFYRRFGYVPFPRRFYEFPLEVMGAGARKYPPDVYLPPLPEEEAKLRPYIPHRDWQARADIYDAFNAGCTGALVERRPANPEAGDADTTGLKWSYEEADGRIAGYAFACLGRDGAQINAAADPAHPTALSSVLRRLLLELFRAGHTRALGRLPFTAAVESRLIEGGVYYVLREVNSYPASNMLLLVDLPRFLQAVCGEWTRRLAMASDRHWCGVLELTVGARSAQLAVTPTAVEATNAGKRADAEINMTDRDFLLLSLGYRDWHELKGSVQGAIPAGLDAVLVDIFRRVPVASGPLG